MEVAIGEGIPRWSSRREKDMKKSRVKGNRRRKKCEGNLENSIIKKTFQHLLIEIGFIR